MTRDGRTPVSFFLDPVCPWAYRTSLWIREVRDVRPIDINWRFLSLRAVNEGTDALKASHGQSTDGFRVMALARREYGEDAVGRLYRTLGEARHERNEDIGQTEVLQRALTEAGLPPDLLERALQDESTQADVQADHAAGVAVGAFGVPTIVIDDEGHGFFGPVIRNVPAGEQAGELWDHFAWLADQNDFYEIKRSR